MAKKTAVFYSFFSEWSCLASWEDGEEHKSLLFQTNSSSSSLLTSSALPLTTSAKDSAILPTSSTSAFACLSLKEINQELWVTIGECDDDENREDEKKGENTSKVDWSKLRTMVKKAGDCAPQALATANLAPLSISLDPLLPLLTLLLLFLTIGEGRG